MSKSKLFMEADYLLGGADVINEATETAPKFEKETIKKIWQELYDDGELLQPDGDGEHDLILSKQFELALQELAIKDNTSDFAIGYIPSKAVVESVIKGLEYDESEKIIIWKTRSGGAFIITSDDEIEVIVNGLSSALYEYQSANTITKFLQWASKKIA